MAHNRSQHLVWLAVPLTFGVYLLTLSPTVGMIDSGELAAGCRLLNILHSTGYPLYTMLGRLASLVPLGTVFHRVAMLSAVPAALGVALLLLLGLRLGLSRPVAGAAALLLGFSFPVWNEAVDVEVFALTLLMVSLLWLLAESAGSGRSLPVLAYVAGLTMTNHLTATSTVLGVALVVILSYRKDLVRRIPALALLLTLGLSPYVFLVLRSRAGPLFPWGNPYNLERFYWTVTGREFQCRMFSLPFWAVMHNAVRGAALLARSLVYVLVPVIFYGAVRLFRQRRNLAIGLIVSAVLLFGYAINYDIPDIESYYIPCVFALIVLAAVGLEGLISNVECRVRGPAARTAVRQAPWLLGIAALVLNFRVAGRQGDYVAYDYMMNMLTSAGQNATIITDWRDLSGPMFYEQHAEHVRPDVCFIDKELLREPWYLDYIERDYPWLVERSRAEIEAYRPYLDQFERGQIKDPTEIERRYIALLESFVNRSPERPAYTTFFDARGTSDPGAGLMFAGVRRAPVGVLFQIRRDTVLPDFDYAKLVVRLPRNEPDSLTRDVLSIYRYFVIRRANALAAFGRPDEIPPLLAWYRSLPVARLAPLPGSN